jgi:endo-1,4-beta-xylanase
MGDVLGPGLRELADPLGIRIGTCVDVRALKGDHDYARTLVREFNLITPENSLKFGVLSPSRGHYNFSEADLLVDFAEAHDMQVHGHVLLWHVQLPHWLLKYKPTRSELIEILTSHVRTVVGRYAGRVASWDVVNEAIASDGQFRDNLWHRTIGPEYLDLAFAAARSADPHARLFYNDYGIEATGPQTDAIYNLLVDLRHRQVPVDGVGLQMHLALEHLGDLEGMSAKLKKFADLNLRVAITELDVRIPTNVHPTVDQLAIQATVYRQVLRSCQQAACSTLVFWGFTDCHSWVPHFFPNHGAALLFDEEYRPKPSYSALHDELAQR